MPETQSQSEPYILFTLGNTTYAVPSRSVQQIEMVEHITPVPNAPRFIEGVVFSRGQVIPAMNLRVRFGFEKMPYDMRTRLIVVSSGGRQVGLIVDAAREFVHIPNESVQPPPDTISGLSGRYLAGIARLGERLVLVLDVDEVLSVSETA